MTYDRKCYDLALVFVMDVLRERDQVERIESVAHRLAERIQRTIEDFLDLEDIKL